jgi:hypothetical protein
MNRGADASYLSMGLIEKNMRHVGASVNSSSWLGMPEKNWNRSMNFARSTDPGPPARMAIGLLEVDANAPSRCSGYRSQDAILRFNFIAFLFPRGAGPR